MCKKGHSVLHDAERLEAARYPSSLPPKPTRGLREHAIDACINIIWGAFMLVNLLLQGLNALWAVIEACRMKPTEPPKTVVIVGASFGGLAAQRELSGRRDVKVKLIDFKNYFEYTPGVRRGPRATHARLPQLLTAPVARRRCAASSTPRTSWS